MGETTCPDLSLQITGPLSLNQPASGVDISYGYVYLLSEWLTPGEALFYSFKRFSLYYTGSSLVIGYAFFD